MKVEHNNTTMWSALFLKLPACVGFVSHLFLLWLFCSALKKYKNQKLFKLISV